MKFDWKITKRSNGRNLAEFHPDPTVAHKNAGAFAEMIISADLLRRGFEVYRSLSAHSSCDLVAIRGDLFFRVEVKSAHVMNGTSGKPTGVLHFSASKLDPENYDLLALFVRETNEVVYRTCDGTEVSP